MNTEELYMQRALELAANGLGSASPNPMVGCVIVYQNSIIGEGWHQKYGSPHAEVNAINSVRDKTLLSKSTAYVTLEPCSHYGKTPPCADLLIKHKVKRVVICNQDPFPEVDGNGIKKLRSAGIEVITGILEEEGKSLNRRFFKNVERKKPYVILKWAETADGFIATEEGEPIAISGKLARMHSHKWRSEEDAIMVGSKTVIHDNPSLTTREWQGKNPIRVVLDSSLVTDPDSRVFDLSSKTYVFTLEDSDKPNFIKIDKNREVTDFILERLYAEGISSLIVEGGPRLHKLFLESNNFDEIRVLKSRKLYVKEGMQAMPVPPNITLKKRVELPEDILSFFSNSFQPF